MKLRQLEHVRVFTTQEITLLQQLRADNTKNHCDRHENAIGLHSAVRAVVAIVGGAARPTVAAVRKCAGGAIVVVVVASEDGATRTD